MPERKVLIVEDEPIIATDLQQILKSSGYHVPDPVSRGEEVLQRLREEDPDVVLMDIVLRGSQDGIETTKKIGELYKVPIVYLTAYRDAKTLGRAFETPYYGYLVKPVDKELLNSTIEMAIHRYAAEQELKERVKELEGLYELNELASHKMPFPELLQIFAEKTAPDSFGRRESVIAEVEFDGESYRNPHSADKDPLGRELTAFITVKGRQRGSISIQSAERYLGSASRYEEKLLGAFADKLSSIIEEQEWEAALKESETRAAEIRQKATEEQLRHELEFKTLVENSPDIVLKIDRARNITYMNTAAQRIFGLDSDTTPPTAAVFNNIIEHDQTVWREKTKLVFSAGTTEENDIGILHKKLLKFYSFRFVPEYAPQGKTNVLIAIGQDITERKLTELAAIESQNNLDTMFQSIGDAVIATDAAGRITRMNPVAEQLTEWSFDEAENKPVADIFHIIDARDGSPVEQPVSTVLREETIIGLSNHTVLVSKYGSERQIADSAAPIKDKTGKTTGVILVFRDVTEDYLQRREIDESHRMLMLILNTIPQRVYWKDSELRYLGCNNAFARDVGLQNSSKLIGKSDFALPFPEEESEQQREKELEILNTGKPEYRNEEIRRQVFGKKMWVEASRVPMRDGEGTIIGIMGTYLDITGRKKAEELMLKAKREWEATFDAVPDLIALIDKEFRIIRVNKSFAEKVGTDARLCVGKKCHSLVHNASAPKDYCPIKEVKKTKAPAFYQTEVPGLGSHYSVSASPLLDSDGNLTSIVLVLKDISDSQRAQAMVKKSLEEKELLLQEIHHRVKNNLQLILSMLNIQARGISELRIRDIITESQNRIRSLSLVHDKLYRSNNFSELNLGFYLKSLVTELFMSYRENVGRLKHVIRVDKIYIDIDTAIPCGLIVNELITNSIKHAFPDNRGGCIELSLEGDDTGFTLTIEDDGVGTNAETRLNQGKSVGFQLVRALVFQIGAEFSQSGGKGSKFIVSWKKPRSS
jgi:PAS domain S-box-containing protein